MKLFNVSLICLFFSIVCLAQTNNSLQFKARIGFNDDTERIEAKSYSTDGTQLTLIGLKTIQTWDVSTAKLIESHAHEIVQLDKFWGTFYEFSPDGSKVVTLDSIGSDGDKKEDRVNAYAYDVRTGKRIAVLERPNYSVRFAFWSADSETLVTFSGLRNQKQTEISFWNGADLSFRTSINVEGYTWHYLSNDGARLYVGNGGQNRVFGLAAGAKFSSLIRVYNTQTGAVERDLTANGADFGVENVRTFVSADERLIAAAGHKRVIVWDISGKSGEPLYELAPREPKGGIELEGFSNDGKYLFARQKKQDEYYDAASGKIVKDVPPVVKLRRETKYIIPNRTNFAPFAPDYRVGDSVLQTPDGRYAVSIPCERATVLDLQTDQTLYTVKSQCRSEGTVEYHPLTHFDVDYFYSNDVFRLSSTGKLLLKLNSNRLIARDLKTGTILQTIERKTDASLNEVPKGNVEWDIRDNNLLTAAKDKRNILIWQINEN